MSRTNTPQKSRALVIITALVAIIAVAWFVIAQSNSKDGADFERAEQAPSIEGQPVYGDPGAKVTIIEFGDYKCPSCKAWGESVWPKLLEDYIESGQANFSYVNVLFHGEESLLGALASESVWQSNPEQFWAFHKKLFDEQPGADHDSEWITEAKLQEVAEATVPGIDPNQLAADLSSTEMIARVETDMTMVDAFDIRLTPTVMINDIVISNPFDYESIKTAIEHELKP